MPIYEIVFGVLSLPVFGLLAMIGFPSSWQNVEGWLLISFIGIPGFLLAITLLVNFPLLLLGALFLCGVAAARR